MSELGNYAAAEFADSLRNAGFRGPVSLNLPLATLTYYKIGGPADVFIEPASVRDLALARNLLNKFSLPLFIMGGGCNLLISDEGIPGIVLRLGKEFSEVAADNENMKISCGASAPIAQVLREGVRISMKNIESITGIPGWVGGAIYMNAGTYGAYIGDLVESVEAMTSEGDILNLPKSECGFAYRTSRFQASGEIIIGCALSGDRGNPDEIAAEIELRMNHRRESQPIDLPSCGCVYRNPDGPMTAAQMIDKAGLKGIRSGEAAVSERHANFIVNLGNAKANDVLILMAIIRKRVFTEFGVLLRPEVQAAGFTKPLEAMLDEREAKIADNESGD